MMEKNFPQMCDDVVHWESGLEVGQPGLLGVFSWTPGDHGGPTRWGVTLAVYAAWRARQTPPLSAPAADDVREMPEEHAITIYRELFYAGPHFDLLPYGIREEIFDIGVGSGPKKAAQLLQDVLIAGGYYSVLEDGVIGAKTIAAANQACEMDCDALRNALIDARERWYDEIVAKNPTQAKFARGWHRRAEELRGCARVEPVPPE